MGAVPLVCKEWRDLARSLQRSLFIPINHHDFYTRKAVTSKKLAYLYSKTTRLESVELKIIVFSEAVINFQILFENIGVLKLNKVKFWSKSLPKTLHSFKLSLRNSVDRSTDIFADGLNVKSMDRISTALNLPLANVFLELNSVTAEFLELGKNTQKGLTVTAESVQDPDVIVRFLDSYKHDIQNITLNKCRLSKKVMERLKKSGLKEMSLQGNSVIVATDLTILFDSESRLKEVESLQVYQDIDEKVVRNIGNSCGKTLRKLHLSDYPGKYYPSASGWVNELKKLTALQDLRLSSVSMSTESWASLFDAESGLKNLGCLDISPSLNLDEDIFYNLATFCGASENLKMLTLCYSSEVIVRECFAKQLRKCSALEEFQLCGCANTIQNAALFFQLPVWE